MPILEVKNLSFSYGEEEKKAIDGLSFSVDKGEYVAIIGHNGSGKSTLSKIIVGLLDHYSGELFLFDNKLTNSNSRSLRSRVGIVFQNPDNQFVGSTVADDIAFGLENREVPHEDMQAIIEQYAEEAGMKAFLSHEPQHLSGGQKQRVAIAGVLAMKPDIVILDEATAMLDPKGKNEIASLIARMKKENPDMAILSITHDVEEAARADKVLVVNSGVSVAYGTPSEVFVQEQLLKDIKLDVPFFYALRSSLRKKGMEIPDSIDTVEKLEDLLCR